MSSSNTVEAFEAGQCLVTPLHGVCEIVERTEQEVLGQVQIFYVLRPFDEPGLLMLPQKGLEPGVRPLIDADGLRDLLRKPVDGAVVPESRPHQRLEAWMRDVKQGCPRLRRRVLWQMGKVRARERKLTPPEDALWERLHIAFRREIELVLGLDASVALDLVNQATETPAPA